MRAATEPPQPWTRIVASPLKRCAAFAEEFAVQRNLPLSLDPRLKEIGFGEWEGKTAQDLEAVDPQQLMRFWSNPERHTPPGAEPIGKFYARVTEAWNELVESHVGEYLLLVVHAGVIRMIISHVLGAPIDNAFRIQVPSAGMTQIRIDRKGAFTLPRLLVHGRQGSP